MHGFGDRHAAFRQSGAAWPSAAAGPDRVTITPILILSSAAAGRTAMPSRIARPANIHISFMVTPLIGCASQTAAAANALFLASKLILTKAVAASEAAAGIVSGGEGMQAARQLLEA